MSNKTYPLGSSEAMKREPRLDEEYYLELKALGHHHIGGCYQALDEMDNSLAKLRINLKELDDMYLEDSINEQYK